MLDFRDMLTVSDRRSRTVSQLEVRSHLLDPSDYAAGSVIVDWATTTPS